MRKIWWAALCAMGAVLCAGQAGAVAVTITADGVYSVESGPSGYFGSAADVALLGGQLFPSAAGDAVLFNIGGVAWRASIGFDTALGDLSGDPATFPGERFSGTIVSGTYEGLGGERDLTGDALHLSLDPFGARASISDGAFSFSVGFPGVFNNLALPTSLTAPFSFASTEIYDPSGSYGDGVLVGNESFLAGFEISPSLPAPEPASWALLILGFAGVGATLRRQKAYAGAEAFSDRAPATSLVE